MSCSSFVYLLASWRESWVWEAEALTLQSSHWSKAIAVKEVGIRSLGIYTWALGSRGEVTDADGREYPGKLLETTFSLPREAIWSMRHEEWVGTCQVTHEEQNKEKTTQYQAQHTERLCSGNGSGLFSDLSKTRVSRLYWCMEGLAWHDSGDMEKGPVIGFWMMLDFILRTKDITCEFKATEQLLPEQVKEVHETSSSQSAVCGPPADP